ncbi:MAG TPA: NRDE family protein [Polyangiales bacterium]
MAEGRFRGPASATLLAVAVCTILYLYRVHPDFPLIVAANRDELYKRPARAPFWHAGDPALLAGVDLQAGGSWLGANLSGLLVGLTNQRTNRLPDPALRSRGEVVMSALRARRVSEVCEQLQALRPSEYNPFNLLFGDADRLCVAYSRPRAARVEIEEAPQGIAVLPNDRIGAPGFPKAERAVSLAHTLRGQPWDRLSSGLASVLADHALPALQQVPQPPPGSFFDHDTARRLQAICLHGEAYGTCCASIIALRPGELVHYLHADGPACRTPFVELAQSTDAAGA